MKMKILLPAIGMLLLLSCQEKVHKENLKISGPLTANAVEIPAGDHLPAQETMTEKEPSSQAFMDFFADFMFSEELQKKSIHFPLPYHQTQIDSGEGWQHVPFYANKSYMPVLYADPVMDNNKNILQEDVKMAVISFQEQQAETFYFDKTLRGWELTKVAAEPFDSLSEADFLLFLERFSADSVYQLKHVDFPLPAPYADDEKDFETTYDTLLVEDWRHLPILEGVEGLLLLNESNFESTFRQIHFSGIENGINVFYTFQKDSAEWRLVKLEDYST